MIAFLSSIRENDGLIFVLKNFTLKKILDKY
jgi:hypothetical protein